MALTLTIDISDEELEAVEKALASYRLIPYDRAGDLNDAKRR